MIADAWCKVVVNRCSTLVVSVKFKFLLEVETEQLFVHDKNEEGVVRDL
jgi:hypothetical protein